MCAAPCFAVLRVLRPLLLAGLLQAETEEADAGAMLEPQQAQQGSVPASPMQQTPAMRPAVPQSPMQQVAAQQAQQQAALPLSPMQQQRQQAQQALGPLARASQFHISSPMPPSSAATLPAPQPSRAGTGAVADSVSSTLEYPSPTRPPRPHAPLAVAFDTAAAISSPPPPPGLQPREAVAAAAPAVQPTAAQQAQQAAPVSGPSQQQQQAAAAGPALPYDPTGHALLCQLEEAAQQGAACGVATAVVSTTEPPSPPARPLGSRDNLAADDVDTQARQNAASVQRQVASMRACPAGERNLVQEAAAAASAK